MKNENNQFNSEFIVNGLRNLGPVIFYKDTEARYVFSNHHKEHTPYDNGHNWDIYGKTDLECRDDMDNAIFVHNRDLELIKNGSSTKYVIHIPREDKEVHYEIQKAAVKVDGKVEGLVGLIVDITEKYELRKQLEEKNKELEEMVRKYELLANTDQLTGLYNRNYLMEWIHKHNNRSMYPLAIISADCNYLKEINDTYGHSKGDIYIQMMSNIFNRVLPQESIKFRIGGDEFLVILPNKTKEEAQYYIDKLNIVQSDYSVENRSVSVSYGLSVIDEFTKDIDKYINEADKNMYADKEKSHCLRKRLPNI